MREAVAELRPGTQRLGLVVRQPAAHRGPSRSTASDHLILCGRLVELCGRLVEPVTERGLDREH